jgi:hypothetical protein
VFALIPANTSVTIHDFSILVDDVLAASTVTAVDAANAVYTAKCTLSLANLGLVRDTFATSEAFNISNATASVAQLKLRVTPGATATVGFMYQLTISEPGF